MNSDNLFEVVVLYYLLIGGMTHIDYQDEFSIISAQMCMVHMLDKTYHHDIDCQVHNHDDK